MATTPAMTIELDITQHEAEHQRGSWRLPTWHIALPLEIEVSCRLTSIGIEITGGD